MAETIDAGIGQRIARYRKLAGFRSSQDLADAIPNPKVTASVLQNIESGRKKDISVGQLLDISKALDLSPIFFLVPIEKPFAEVDLANVGSDVARMKSFEVVDLLFGSSPADSVPSMVAQRTLLEMRNLISAVSRYRELMSEHLDNQSASETSKKRRSHIASRPTDFLWPNNSSDAVAPKILAAVGFLSQLKIDLLWAQDVIDDIKRTNATRDQIEGNQAELDYFNE